ncbi:MAG: DegV family protein [Bacilli bacterium]|nr:DegV family protein [Bacilli bacterium]
MLRIFTDTDTDMTPEMAKKYGYELISMPYTIDGKTTYPYKDKDFKTFDPKKFYDVLRKGVLPTTSALNAEEYKAYFEPVFKKGDDILYVHFSAAMSGTFNSMNLALEELKEKYPERKFYEIDTKGITLGSLNIVLEVGDLYKQGKSVEEILAWADKEVDKFAIYFYADDLKFFAKSGRVGGLKAVMGNLMGIRPIIYMGEDGKMTNIGSCRGEKAVLKKLVDYARDLQEDINKHRVIIGHTDALDNAQKLGELLKEEFGKDLEIEYYPVNPTAGSHCGPNCVGVSFHAKRRSL